MAYKKIKSLEPEWINSSDQEIDLDTQEGFVYLITNQLTGKKYIGRKYFWKRLRKKVPGRVYRKRVKEESDWKTYWGSCEPLHLDYFSEGIGNFQREILSIHTCRSDVCYEEVAYQFKYDVLRRKNEEGEYLYYNSNIGNKYFRRSDESYEAAGEKISKTLKERFKEGYVHPMKGKVHPNKGKKINSGHGKVAKPYKFTDPNGNIVTGTNISELCKKYGLDHSTMSIINRNGRLKKHKGWTK